MPPKSDWTKQVFSDAWAHDDSRPHEITAQQLDHDIGFAIPRAHSIAVWQGRQSWVLAIDEPDFKVMVQISSDHPMVITYRRQEE